MAALAEKTVDKDREERLAVTRTLYLERYANRR